MKYELQLIDLSPTSFSAAVAYCLPTIVLAHSESSRLMIFGLEVVFGFNFNIRTKDLDYASHSDQPSFQTIKESSQLRT